MRLLVGLAGLTCSAMIAVPGMASDLTVNRFGNDLERISSHVTDPPLDLDSLGCKQSEKVVCTFVSSGGVAFFSVGPEVNGPIDVIVVDGVPDGERADIMAGFEPVFAIVEPSRSAQERGEVMASLINAKASGTVAQYDTGSAFYQMEYSSETGYRLVAVLRE